MRSLIKIAAVSVAMLCAESAQAGELFRNSQRLSQQGNFISPRRIQPSTKAEQLIDRNRGNPSAQQPGLNQTSPYEYRIVSYDKAVQKYQSDYARWETSVAQLQQRDEQKKAREKANAEQRAKQQKDRDQRQAAKDELRLAKLKAKGEDKGKSGGIFGRAFGTSSSEPTNVIQDDKAKKAESFFGNAEDTTAANPAQPPKLSFWQRLKKALFGG